MGLRVGTPWAPHVQGLTAVGFGARLERSFASRPRLIDNCPLSDAPRSLRDVFVSYSGNLYLVFELLDMDLKRVFDEHRKFDAAARRAAESGTVCPVPRPTTPSAYPQQPGGLSLEMCRALLFQMVAGLNTCHERRYLHRDLKPHNVLVNRTGETKLADFGLARPPEVLLGGEVYTAALDLWSVGCIFAEMACGRPLFPGDSEIDQMHRMFEGLGTPNEDTWRGCTSLRNWRHDFPQWRGRGLAALVPGLPPSAAELLAEFLHFDPSCRISARNALRHPFLASSGAAVAAAGGAGLARSPFPTAGGAAAEAGAGAGGYDDDEADDDDDMDDDFEM